MKYELRYVAPVLSAVITTRAAASSARVTDGPQSTTDCCM